MTNAIGSAHFTIQNHKKYKIVKTKKTQSSWTSAVHRLWLWVIFDEVVHCFWVKSFGTEPLLLWKYGFEPYLVICQDYLMVLSYTVSEFWLVQPHSDLVRLSYEKLSMCENFNDLEDILLKCDLIFFLSFMVMGENCGCLWTTLMCDPF